MKTGNYTNSLCEKPVFIVGGSRTGSELIKRILRKYTDIDFVDEMFLLSPKWLHKDFLGRATEHIGSLESDYDVDRLVKFMYSGDLYGYFWTAIKELDREELTRQITESDRSLCAIFKALMEVHAIHNGKKRCGAKFPMHYSHIDTLNKWFPGCSIIHTTRDPRAVYVSQSSKYSRASYSRIKNLWVASKQFVHIAIQTVWTASIHVRNKGRGNYLLFRYEDFLSEPENEMRLLCDFLSVDFTDEMAAPTLHSNSSFSDKYGVGKGLQKSSADSWRKRISPAANIFIKCIGWRAMGRLGY